MIDNIHELLYSLDYLRFSLFPFWIPPHKCPGKAPDQIMYITVCESRVFQISTAEECVR